MCVTTVPCVPSYCFCQTPIMYSATIDLHVHLKCFKSVTLPFCLSSGNETYYSSQGRVILRPHGEVPNAVLVIQEATMEDRGLYSCNATNANNFTDGAAVYVRVKGKECSTLPAFCFIFHVVLNE